MRSTNTKGLLRRLGHSDDRSSLLVRGSKGTERVLEDSEERDVILLLLNDYKASKKNLKRRLLEQNSVLKTMIL